MKTKIIQVQFKHLFLVMFLAFFTSNSFAQCVTDCAALAGSDKVICCPGGSTTIGGPNCECVRNGGVVKNCSTICSGTTYSWAPSTGLSSTTVCNPTASPSVTTTYTLYVTFGSRCCCDGASGSCHNDTCGTAVYSDAVTVTVNNSCCRRDDNGLNECIIGMKEKIGD